MQHNHDALKDQVLKQQWERWHMKRLYVVKALTTFDLIHA